MSLHHEAVCFTLSDLGIKIKMCHNIFRHSVDEFATLEKWTITKVS